MENADSIVDKMTAFYTLKEPSPKTISVNVSIPSLDEVSSADGSREGIILVSEVEYFDIIGYLELDTNLMEIEIDNSTTHINKGDVVEIENSYMNYYDNKYYVKDNYMSSSNFNDNDELIIVTQLDETTRFVVHKPSNKFFNDLINNDKGTIKLFKNSTTIPVGFTYFVDGKIRDLPDNKALRVVNN